MDRAFSELAGRTILCVDDSPHITSLLHDVLDLCGAEVVAVNSGLDAMTVLEVRDFDMMILDLHMPSPDGWDVLDYLRREKPSMFDRTVLLTGQRYSRELARKLEGMSLRSVYKPFDLDALREACCEVLRRHRTTV